MKPFAIVVVIGCALALGILVLLIVAAVGVLVFFAPGPLPFDISMHPSDEELIAHFKTHSEGFARLLALVRGFPSDAELHQGRPDSVTDAHWEEYLRLTRDLGITGHVRDTGWGVLFPVSKDSIRSWKGYVYLIQTSHDGEQAPSLDEVQLFEYSVYRRALGDQWYLYLQGGVNVNY